MSTHGLGPLVLTCIALAACTVEVRSDDSGTVSMSQGTTVPATDSMTTETPAESSSGPTDDTAVDSTGGDKLDVGVMPTGGCQYLDLLFVIDNSSSMQTYQSALAEQFPAFVTAMYDELPAGVDVHVGITTTDFDNGCSDAEATANCQSASSLADIESHYVPPTVMDDGGNGTQGRLFEWAGQRYFESNSSDDPADLSSWFSSAATAAGEAGCSFEMPVAAAGWMASEANAGANVGFLRDEGGLLVVFFLTDEPDKSPESKSVYAEMILDAKAGCGGAQCVFVSGLFPGCVEDINQKLWQFIEEFGEPPTHGNILDTANYDDLVGEVLAEAVGSACANVPVG